MVLPARIQHMIHGERYVEEAVERLLKELLLRGTYGEDIGWDDALKDCSDLYEVRDMNGIEEGE